MTEHEKLKAFFRDVMVNAFDGFDTDGGEAQELAESLGLAHWEKYDHEKHHALGSFEGDSGDDILILNLEAECP